MFILGMKLLVNIKSNNDNKIISWTNNEKIDKNINTMKIKIFRFLNLQINFLLRYCPQV
jgi:DNA-binding NtrC family response regulator